jgi:Cache domain
MTTFYPSLEERPSSGGLSLGGHMMVLIGAILLPMLGLVAIIAWDYGQAVRRTIEAERLDVANNIRIMIDREIDRTVGFLDGISDSPGLRSNNPEIVGRVMGMARGRGFASLTLYHLDGRPMMATTELSPAVTPQAVGLAEIKAGRPYFVSSLIATGEKPGLYFVSVPIRDKGELLGMLTGGLPTGRLQGVLAESGLRKGWTSSIVDRDGILLARGTDAQLYVGLEAQQPMADAARGKEMSGLFDELNRGGISIKNSFERSTTSGWAAGVGVPTEIVEAPLRRTALFMTAIGAILTLASLVFGFLVANHLSRAIRRMGLAAAAIASGDAVRMPESNITELRDVSRSIEVTGEVARRDRRAQNP